MVFLATADISGDDGPATFLGWEIPARLAAEFASYMTGHFGKPQESITSFGAMIAASRGAPVMYSVISDGDDA